MKPQNVPLVLMLVTAVMLMAQSPAPEIQIQQMEQQLAQNPDNADLNLNLGKLKYQMSMKGDKALLKESVKLLKKATKLDPQNSIAFCWYGSAFLSQARYIKFTPFKSYYVVAGLKEMDKGIELDEMNVESRFIRGQTCLQIPTLFGRLGTAIEDFEKLQQIMTNAPDKFDHETQAQILYCLGIAYAKNGDDDKSSSCFKKIKADYTDTDYINKIDYHYGN